MSRITLRFLIGLLLAVAGTPVRADFAQEFAAGHYAQAASVLGALPAGSAQRGEAVNSVLGVLPLMQWSPAVSAAWSQVMAAIEGSTNSFWAVRNLGALLAAAAVAGVPRNAEMTAITERAVAASSKWGADGKLTAARGLLWYGDYDRAFSLFEQSKVPEPVVDLAFEVLVDKPALGGQPALWKMVQEHMGPEWTIARKAIRALAYAGHVDDALQLSRARQSVNEQVDGATIAARYARYGKHAEAGSAAMVDALSSLSRAGDTGESLLLFRDLLKEARESKPATIPEAFWLKAQAWVTALSPASRPAALTEFVGAAAWMNRPNLEPLLQKVQGTSWEPACRMRLACGWWWNGWHDKASGMANAITDPSWRALAFNEIAYLAAQAATLPQDSPSEGGETALAHP